MEEEQKLQRQQQQQQQQGDQSGALGDTSSSEGAMGKDGSPSPTHPQSVEDQSLQQTMDKNKECESANLHTVAPALKDHLFCQ